MMAHGVENRVPFLDRRVIEFARGLRDDHLVDPAAAGAPATKVVVKELAADALVVLETDALPRLFADIESSLRLADDYVAQGVTMWRVLKRMLGRGIWIEPAVLDLIPVVGADALQRTFDLLIPDGGDDATRAGDRALGPLVRHGVPDADGAREGFRRNRIEAIEPALECPCKGRRAPGLDRGQPRRILTRYDVPAARLKSTTTVSSPSPSRRRRVSNSSGVSQSGPGAGPPCGSRGATQAANVRSGNSRRTERTALPMRPVAP